MISGHWKKGNSDSDEPILLIVTGVCLNMSEIICETTRFIPLSVCRASLKEEFAFYGISEGIDVETAERLIAERNEVAAMNAAKESITLFSLQSLST